MHVSFVRVNVSLIARNLHEVSCKFLVTHATSATEERTLRQSSSAANKYKNNFRDVDYGSIRVRMRIEIV